MFKYKRKKYLNINSPSHEEIIRIVLIWNVIIILIGCRRTLEDFAYMINMKRQENRKLKQTSAIQTYSQVSPVNTYTTNQLLRV